MSAIHCSRSLAGYDALVPGGAANRGMRIGDVGRAGHRHIRQGGVGRVFREAIGSDIEAPFLFAILSVYREEALENAYGGLMERRLEYRRSCSKKCMMTLKIFGC